MTSLDPNHSPPLWRSPKPTACSLSEGMTVASRIETKAALKQIFGGKRELTALANKPLHQQETAIFIGQNLKGLWKAAKNAQLDEAARLLECAFCEVSKFR